ncbi:hypothetical protein GCM10027511_14690 [Hymenobacter humi]
MCGVATSGYAQVDTIPPDAQIIIDPVEPVAFKLERKKPHATLPAALRRKGITGFAAVQVAITPDGGHRLVRVLKVSVTELGQATLEVNLLNYQAETIPYSVQSLPYYPLLVAYVKRDVSFRPTHQGPVSPSTSMVFKIGFQ